MDNITEDKWDEDVWGVEHEDAASAVEIPKLFFYFGAHVSEFCWQAWSTINKYFRIIGLLTILGIS